MPGWNLEDVVTYNCVVSGTNLTIEICIYTVPVIYMTAGQFTDCVTGFKIGQTNDTGILVVSVMTLKKGLYRCNGVVFFDVR